MTAAPRPSLANLLDDVRPLIARARLSGNPRFVLVPPELYDLVASYRERDRAMGLPPTILGLEIVRADEPAAALRVF